MTERTLVCAGRPVAGAQDEIRRYCGLPWRGGEPETWAYKHYDLTPTGPDDFPGPPDFLAAAVIHPGFGNAEMVFFRGEGGAEACQQWLSQLPRNVDLADADEQTLGHLATLPELADGQWLAILSKVAHRKRPKLVPLFDKAIVDWYRPVTGLRGSVAWPALIQALHEDLAMPENRQFLGELRAELGLELGTAVPSNLRLVDIAIWMDGRKG